MTKESTLRLPSFVFGQVSDAGRSGKNNEDSADTFQARLLTQQNGNTVEAPLQVAIVADGIGGNVAGETASRAAVDTIKDFFRSREYMAVPERLVEAITTANRQIYERALAEPALLGMGTTIVAAAIAENRLYVAHAGDSRAYLLRNGQLHRLTLDHTWAQEAIEAGRLTPAQAKEHPNRHVIKRFLGISETVAVDSTMIDINQHAFEAEQFHHWAKTEAILLQPGDSVLLCSDGLTDVVDDEQMAATLSRYEPQESAQRLVDQANRAGGPDNITVVVMQWSNGLPTVAIRTAKQSPLLALTLALILVAGAAGYLLADYRATEPMSVLARTNEDTQRVAIGLTTATVTEETRTEQTVPSRATIMSSTTAIAQHKTAQTATSAPVTSTPMPITLRSSFDKNGEKFAPIDMETTPIEEIEGTQNAVTTLYQSTEIVDPTSTPIPDFSPTATATTLPTATATPTVHAAATKIMGPTVATVEESATPSQLFNDFADAAVILLEPGNGDTVNSPRTFSWQTNFDLPTGYAYEPIFWKEGEDPLLSGDGYGGTTELTSKNFAAEALIGAGAHNGDYYWGIILVQTTPTYDRIKFLGGGSRIRIDAANKSDSDETTTASGPRR